MLTLGYLTLVNGAGEEGDAVPADLVAKVLAGDADGTGGRRLQDAPLQVIPLLWVGQGAGSGHEHEASTFALLAAMRRGQGAPRGRKV